MIPIYCITVPDQPWKRAVSEKHFEEMEFLVTFVDAFNGSLLGLQASMPHYINESKENSWITGPQISCVLSHLAIMSVLVAQEHDEFIIIEDDIVVPKDWEKRWTQIRSEIPDNIGCVQLEHAFQSGKPNQKVSDNLSKIGYPFSSGAIWWRKETAKQAIRMMRPINSPMDVMLLQRVYPFLGHLAATPTLFRQRTGDNSWPSSIFGI